MVSSKALRLFTSVLLALSLSSLPVLAEGSSNLQETQPAIESPDQGAVQKALLLAQACPSCGANLAATAAVGAVSISKKKDDSVLTDSLWGNLILEMAYQRDDEMKKYVKRVNLLNVGTLSSIGAITAGTLAQGVVAVATLNPPDGKPDSYIPGGLGIGFSGATILTFAARTYFGHRFSKQLKDRQLAIKERVEVVLDHLEYSDAKCPDAKKELETLIGERACNEWLQLWRSSHKLALSEPPKISLSSMSK